MNVEQMADNYRRGWSLMEIAEDVGLSTPTVRKRLAEQGVAIRAPGAQHGKPHSALVVAPEAIDDVLPLGWVRSSLLLDAKRAGFDDVVALLEARP